MSTKLPTKKQRELLNFIDNFITGHGYGPSYREIMRGLGYKSVSTVAAHIDNLVASGHLVKRGNSARSLELVREQDNFANDSAVKPEQEKWLIDKIRIKFEQAENGSPTQKQIDELYVLIGALKVLGFDDAARAFIGRLSSINNQIKSK